MSPDRRAFLTGITGQDGSYLAELLLEKGYEVHGMVRRASTEKFERIEHIRERITLHQADLLDQRSLVDALRAANPTEIYNLAAISRPGASWEDPVGSSTITGLGVTRLLEAAKISSPEARYCQASSSEMFGDARESPQNESTELRPRSPYGAAKAYGHLITGMYRRNRGLCGSSAILFNHESPRRGLSFLTRKITWHAAAIKHGIKSQLKLGDLDAERDWGYAPDYVEAMWLMLQQEDPGDYVIATGRSHSVRECLEIAFHEAGLGDYEQYVISDPAFVRPREETPMIGDAAKAGRVLGWKPKTGFEEMVRMMTRTDLQLVATGR